MSSVSAMIKTIVIASSAVSQAGLESMLKGTKDIQVLSSFSGLRDWTQLLDADGADVLLVENRKIDASELQELSTFPFNQSMPALVLLTSERNRRTLRQGLALGLRGLLPSAATAAEIIAAVRAAANNMVVIHVDFQRELFEEELAFAAGDDRQLEALTPREQEVLSLVFQGMTNRAIAGQLHLSEHTVKFHIGSIFEKLRVSSRTEAVSIGIRQGLILL
jgi:two-component system, NarL family, response regulator YdfI